MKFLLIIIALWIFFSLSLSAQQNLVGTWEHRNDSVWSIKIITPSHWMEYSETYEKRFVMAKGGTYSLSGNKYEEIINISSLEFNSEIKTDFIIENKGDKFHKRRSKKAIEDSIDPVDEVWIRIKSPELFLNNPSIGTWNQLSSAYTLPDETIGFHTNDAASRVLIVSPSHWIKMSLKEGIFESISGGTYRMEGNKLYPVFDFSSHTNFKVDYTEIDQEVEGNKLYWKGYAKRTDGTDPLRFEDEFQRICTTIIRIEH